MRNNIRLSVLFPSYLEENNLRFLLPRLMSVLGELHCTYEVIVIDTVKPLDHTQDVCVQHNVKYINRYPSNSYGDAIRCGIDEAQGEYTLFMDADGSHPPEFIPELYKNIDLYDVVIASRYVPGGSTQNNKVQIIMSRILNLSYAIFLNIKCKDVSNSFKIYRSFLLKEIKLNCRNFDIIEEILFKLNNKNRFLKIKEVPFLFQKRIFGETKRNLVIFVLTYLYTLLKLRFGK